MNDAKRVWRSGVRFDCPDCGQLWKDDDHATVLDSACIACGGDVRLVGKGERMVGFAEWYRCPGCGQLHMLRRGELVRTGNRAGFEEFTLF